MLNLSDVSNLSREIARRIINRATGDIPGYYGDSLKINRKGQLFWHSGSIFPCTFVDDVDYEVRGKDVIVVVLTSATLRTVTLPPSQSRDRRLIIVKRIGAGAVSVVPSGAELIDGAASFSLDVDYKSVGLIGSGKFPGYAVIFSYL